MVILLMCPSELDPSSDGVRDEPVEESDAFKLNNWRQELEMGNDDNTVALPQILNLQRI
jgi:hypothetical protein